MSIPVLTIDYMPFSRTMPGIVAGISDYLEQVPSSCSMRKRKPTGGMYSVTDAKSRRGSLRCCGYFFFILGPPRRVRSIFASRATSARIGSRVCLCVRSGTTSTILSRRSETDCLAHAYANRAHFPCISSAQTFIHAQSLIELCRVLSAPLLIIDKEDCIAKAFIRLLHRHHRVDYSGFWRR